MPPSTSIFRTDVERHLLKLCYLTIGIDPPNNFSYMVDFCCKDILESTTEDEFTSEDIKIAFRRFLEQVKSPD